MRVILVDDEVDLVSTMADRLELRGISTAWAASAAEAMSIIEKECFDIAVLDIKMPEINGVELMQRIQSKCPKTRFIFISGHGSEQTYSEVTEKCKEAVYLIKPVDIHILIEKMNEMMECIQDPDV
jgi:DNA-binding NtrC family response regulator